MCEQAAIFLSAVVALELSHLLRIHCYLSLFANDISPVTTALFCYRQRRFVAFTLAK